MPDEFVRLLGSASDNGRGKHELDGAVSDWLDMIETERQITIMRLRAIDRVLVQHNRLRRETLPTRVR